MAPKAKDGDGVYLNTDMQRVKMDISKATTITTAALRPEQLEGIQKQREKAVKANDRKEADRLGALENTPVYFVVINGQGHSIFSNEELVGDLSDSSA